MRTREDLIALVLQNLGVLASGQSPAAEDRETVDLRIDLKLAELGRREVFVGLDADALDDAVFLYVADILTFACAAPFGIAGTKRDEVAKTAAEAEAMLKGMARQFDAGTATSSLFDPVQVALEALGIVSAGQTASDKDRAVVTARVQPKLMELYGRDICGVTDISLLSPELQGAFARLLAADCALSFSEVPPQRIAMLMAMVTGAEQVLRYQSFVYDVLRPMRAERFWGRRNGARPAPGVSLGFAPIPGTINVILDGGEL